MQDNFGIRSDYMARQTADTRECAPADYWNAYRIGNAALYQYDVYRAVAGLLSERSLGARAVADIGCGYPIKAQRLLSPYADSVTLFDQGTLQPVVEERFPSLAFQGIDLEQPDHMEASFDVTVCSDVLEHLLNPDPCLDFLKHITKRDGLLVLSTPEREVLRGSDCLTSPKPEHVREWTRDEFSAYLESRGLLLRRHVLLPEKRLNWLESLLAPVLGRIRRHRRWVGCQLAICSVSR